MASSIVRRSRLLQNVSAFTGKTTFDLWLNKCVRSHGTVAKWLVYTENGDPSKVIELEEKTLLPPKGDEVLVKMLAAPVNPADINTIQGVYPVKPVLPAVGGNEGVGEVMATGSAVKDLRVGDHVVPKFSGWGTWRTHAVCPEGQILKISKKVDIVQAATMSVNPCTAYRMLKDFVKLKPGDVVIQNAANSACGVNVIQLAKVYGYQTVNIVRNRDDIDGLRKSLLEIGATHVLTEEEVREFDLFKTGKLSKPKLALNAVGGKSSMQMFRYLDKNGYMVTYGGMSMQPVMVPTGPLIFNDVKVVGFWMTRWINENHDTPECVRMKDELSGLMIAGKVKPPPHTVISFSKFREVLQNTMNPAGKVGVKYVMDFQSSE